MLSEGPAKVFNPTERVEKAGEIRQRTNNKEIQGNYPNFVQKLAGEENFVISKVNERQLLFGICCLRAATFQGLKTRVLSTERRIWKQKLFAKRHVFSLTFRKKTQQKKFRSTRRLQEN